MDGGSSANELVSCSVLENIVEYCDVCFLSLFWYVSTHCPIVHASFKFAIPKKGLTHIISSAWCVLSVFFDFLQFPDSQIWDLG